MPRTDSFGQTITELWMQKIILEKQAEAVAARNAEIAAAVRGLKPETLGVKTSVGFYRLRASVLAIIEGRG